MVHITNFTISLGKVKGSKMYLVLDLSLTYRGGGGDAHRDAQEEGDNSKAIAKLASTAGIMSKNYQRIDSVNHSTGGCANPDCHRYFERNLNSIREQLLNKSAANGTNQIVEVSSKQFTCFAIPIERNTFGIGNMNLDKFCQGLMKDIEKIEFHFDHDGTGEDGLDEDDDSGY